MSSGGSNQFLPSGSSPGERGGGGGGSYSVNSKIMIVAIVVLFGVVFFILGLHIYAKWFWRHGGGLLHAGGPVVSWRRRRRLEVAMAGQTRIGQVGLDDSVKESLPTFEFNSEKAAADGLECAVCLEEFAEGEKGRLLPKCNHSFHIDCIDMWFQSNSTCPLCRCSVVPDPQSDPEPSVLVEPTPLPRETPHSPGLHITPPHTLADRTHFVSEDLPAQSVLNYHRDEQQSVRIVTDGMLAHQISENSAAAAAITSLPMTELSSSQRDTSGADLSPKANPPVQYPSNVLFWGNQSQVNVGYGVSREEGVTRQISEAGINAPSCLVIEIPRISATAALGTVAAGDKPAESKSPVSRIMSSSFRRLMSMRRGATVSPEVDGSPTAIVPAAGRGSDVEVGGGLGGPATIISVPEGTQRIIVDERQ